MRDFAKSLALTVPEIRRLYDNVLAANQKLLEANKRIAQLERDVIWRDRQLEAMRILGERVDPMPSASNNGDLADQKDIIFITQDGRRLAPARARCYNFAEILNKRYGLKTGVLSFVDHLGMPDLGSGPVDFITDDVKLRLNAEAMRLLLRNPKAILFSQKTGYHFLAVLGAAVLQWKSNHPGIWMTTTFITIRGPSWTGSCRPSVRPRRT